MANVEVSPIAARTTREGIAKETKTHDLEMDSLPIPLRDGPSALVNYSGNTTLLILNLRLDPRTSESLLSQLESVNHSTVNS